MSRTNRPGASAGDPFRDIADDLDRPLEPLAEAMRRFSHANPTPPDKGVTIEPVVDRNDIPAAQLRRGGR